MKELLSIFTIMCFFIMGCQPSKSDTYMPSIKDLRPNESLLMNMLVCHRKCRANTIEFNNGHAVLIPTQLKLSPKQITDTEKYFGTTIVFDSKKNSLSLKLSAEEISDLDTYFQTPASNCSNVIKIGFEHKKKNKRLNSQILQIYPCSKERNKITPMRLLHYLEDDKIELPYWRLSAQEYDEWQRTLYD